MSDFDSFPPPMTSTLNDVRNDTGRVAFCGPFVLSAITGYPISKVETAVNAYRNLPPDLRHRVKGTYADEVEARSRFMVSRWRSRKPSCIASARSARRCWTWMQKPRNAWAHYILAIHKGKEGHWILIKGVKMCDTFTEGQWTFVVDGPHRGARIMEVFEVRKSLDI